MVIACGKWIGQLANALGKGMNSSILPPAMGKTVRQTGLFNKVWQLELWIQTSCNIRKLCCILPMVEGLGVYTHTHTHTHNDNYEIKVQ